MVLSLKSCLLLNFIIATISQPTPSVIDQLQSAPASNQQQPEQCCTPTTLSNQQEAHGLEHLIPYQHVQSGNSCMCNIASKVMNVLN